MSPLEPTRTPTTLSATNGGGKEYVNKSALLQLVVAPKQKHLIHSEGTRASSLNCPAGHTPLPVITTRTKSGTAIFVVVDVIASHE